MWEAMIWAWTVEERREEIVREVRTNRLAKKGGKPGAGALYAAPFFRELKLDLARLVRALTSREETKKKGDPS